MKNLGINLAASIAMLSISASLAGDVLMLLQEQNGPADSGVAELPANEPPGLRFTDSGLSGGFVHEFGSDFSGTGSVSVDRGFAGFKAEFECGTDFSGSMGIAWGGDWYDFDGDSKLSPEPGTAPWTDVQAIALLARTTTKIDSRWSATVGLDLRFAGERNADFNDSITIGGLGAVSYAFSRTLSLGAGAIVSSQIEDSILVIPALIVYWQVTDTVVVSNVLGPEVYPTGAGIELAWRPDSQREVAIGGRYESRRFRLDDTGPAARRNGVGQDTGYPFWARATWRFENGIRLDLVGGVSLFNTYRLDDADGNEIAQSDLDPSPFVGFFASWRF